MSLRWRFSLPVTAALAVLFGVAWLFARELLTPPAVADAESALLREVRLAAAHLDDALAEVTRATAGLARQVEAVPGADPLPLLAAEGLGGALVVTRAVFLAPGGEDLVARTLRAESGEDAPAVDEAAVAELAGRLVRVSRELERPYWSTPLPGDPVAGEPLVRRVVPVREGERVVGVVTAGVALARLHGVVERLVPDARVSVLDGEGTFLSHREGAWILERSLVDVARELGWSALADLDTLLPAEAPTVVRLEGFEDQPPHWIAFAPLEATGWTLAMAVPRARMLGGLERQLRDLALLLGALVAVAGILLVVTSWRLLAPLGSLAEGAESMLAHGGDAAPAGRRRDELERLVAAVRGLGERLDAQAAALRRMRGLPQQAHAPAGDSGPRAGSGEEAGGGQASAGEQAAPARVQELEAELDQATARLEQLRAEAAARDAELARGREETADAARRAAEVEAARAAAQRAAEALEEEVEALWRESQGEGGRFGAGVQVAVRLRCPGPAERVWCDLWPRAGGALLVLGRMGGGADAQVLLRVLGLRLALAAEAVDEAEPPALLRQAQAAWRRRGGRSADLGLLVAVLADRGGGYAVQGQPEPLAVAANGVVAPRLTARQEGLQTGQIAPGERLLLRAGTWAAALEEESLALLLTTHEALEPEALADLLAGQVVDMAPGAACAGIVVVGLEAEGDGAGAAAAGPLGRLGGVLRRRR